MSYDIIGNTGIEPTVAVLCPSINTKSVHKYYYDPYLHRLGEDLMICDLYKDPVKKKTPVVNIKEYLEDLIPNLIDAGINLLVVTNPDYFKVLTKQGKTDATIGDVLNTIVGPSLKATYCPGYARVFYDPEKILPRIGLALNSAVKFKQGDKSVIGANIIHSAQYPKTTEDIIKCIDMLDEMDCDLSCDIEGFSLKHYSAGIGSITFCWDKHNGVAFPVDYVEHTDPENKLIFGREEPNHEVRERLAKFFVENKNRIIYHNISYDAYVLVYQLFMDHILDQQGLLHGLEIMTKNWECTQLITYLATNSCAGNELGLKVQGQEFAGNYAQEDIKDIRLIPLDELLKYNLIDGLATWYVYEKHMPTVIADMQEEVYNEIFRPATKDIIQMQLTGMPINMEKVVKLQITLTKESEELQRKMENLGTIEHFIDVMKDEMVDSTNARLKTKQITKADIGKTKGTIVEFNPNSANQLQRLLFSEDFLDLPILDYTKSKAPATGAETLEKLINHTSSVEVKLLLELLIEYKASAIILSTFLPAFLKAHIGVDGWHYLFGNFRLGGTASGRLSSNGPNLQNIPSSGSSKIKQRLAKLIKECFEAPPGWLFVGLDFDSLEDKISAITTKDPMKIKVYSDGYDGHCLRALAYFAEDMPDILLCPEDATPYVAIVDGKEIYFHSTEEVTYEGVTMTGEDLWLKLKDK